MTENNTQEETKQEETKQEETKQEETEKEDFSQAIAEVKASYEEKLAKQKTGYEKKLKEREDVIKQLLTGETTESEPSIIDKINERRLKQCKW